MIKRPILLAAGTDVVSILVFVAIGRRSHEESGNVVVGALGVAAPFLIGLAGAWAVTKAWKHPIEPGVGVLIWLVTVALGMVLRHFAFDRGTATPFIIVATVALGVLLVGWRLLAQLIARRHLD
jgi:Protein of unknown function (DUF3054)